MLILKKIFRCLTQVACLLLLGSMYLAEIIVPSLTLLQKDVKRIVCMSPTSLANAGPLDLSCQRNARMSVTHAISGLQSRALCPQMIVESSADEASSSCSESIKTTQVIEEKCGGRRNCTISLNEPVPHNCPSDLFSYMEITFRCVLDKLPHVPFARHRVNMQQGIQVFRRNHNNY